MKRYLKDVVAIDIETIPGPSREELDPSVRKYVERKLKAFRKKDPGMNFGKFASLSGDFGRIVCISAAVEAVDDDGESSIAAYSYTGDEEKMLRAFNRGLVADGPLFVHYNGLNFDIPYILKRMAYYGIKPANARFADLRRFQTHSHYDLMEVWASWDRSKAVPLGVLSVLHGLPSPKGDIDGSKVAEVAMQPGGIDRIARYCEWDVASTINLYRKLVKFQDPIPPDRHYLFEDIPGGERVYRRMVLPGNESGSAATEVNGSVADRSAWIRHSIAKCRRLASRPWRRGRPPETSTD